MKRIDYLKLAVQKRLYSTKAWMVSAFSVFREAENAYQKNPYFGRLISQPWGLDFVGEDGQIVKIEDSKPGEPLLRWDERVQIDPTWIANCKAPLETSVGTLLVNAICLVDSFGTKIDFMEGAIRVGRIEGIVAPLLTTNTVSNERDPKRIYVDEYLKLGQSFEYLKVLLQLAAVAATPKGLVAPPGVKEFKAALLKKYAGQLSDPVKMAQFEQELKDFDKEFMKDDPSFGKFSSGKIMHTARKKMFLTIGSENGFETTNTVVPITNSLQEGWPLDAQEYTALMNGIRSGSYSRGAETVKGGVAAKYLLRAANNFEIDPNGDCGSQLGHSRKYNKDNVASLYGRTVIQGSKQIKVNEGEDLGAYLGQVVTTRSPMYCKREGDRLCGVCTGDRLKRYESGVPIPLTEISAIILTAALKKFHTSGLNSVEMEFDDIFS